MARRVIRAFAILMATFPWASGLRADFAPAAWRNEPLATAGTNLNEWYFNPDATAHPRIMVKATVATGTPNVARKLLTGGPPSWTAGSAVNLQLARPGAVFVPTSGGGGFLIAQQGTALKMAIFDSSGAATIENVDTLAGTFSGISAELDATGGLHLGYIWNNATICYARRSLQGAWTIAPETLPSTVIHQTAVVPLTSSNVSLYYTATALAVRTLWRCTPKVHPRSGTLLISYPALAASGSFPALPENKRVNMENYVGPTLRGSRAGAAGRVYYFGTDGGNSWKFRRTTNDSLPLSPETLETIGTLTAFPKSIHVAFGPGGNQRAAWYNAANKSIHYLKPPAALVDVPVPAGNPVALAGSPVDPDLLGFHFGPDGTPYLLYRTSLAAAFVAFPNDNFDFNRNGRPEILDTAFNSTVAGLEILPVGPAAAGVADSADRLKIRFPTVGAATINPTGGIQTTSQNLLYQVELSPDLQVWTVLNTFGSISYTATPASGALKTFVGVVPVPAPGAFDRRYARLKVTRLSYPY